MFLKLKYRKMKNNRNPIVILFLALCLLVFGNASAQKKDLKIGLALSGGGAKGLAHIGVIKVLEKAGVKIDYITGTSMGAVVGGLYAIGYSADFIDQKARITEWNKLIKDEVERKRLSFEEKLAYQKYVLTLPFNKKGIHLPRGMRHGQGISFLLNDFTKPVHCIHNFSDYKIPFKCIAANMITGTADVLDHGSLSEAIRASMAIPSVFTPVEIDGNLYVDGGLFNNFPAVEVKEMGADIVIGVDLQSPFYEKSEIISTIELLDQASKFLRLEANRKARELCDIVIKPKVTHYSLLGFDQIDEIIALGERAAREALPDILKMLDSLGVKHNKRIIKEVPQVEMVYLDTVIINGVSDRFRKRILESANFRLYHKESYQKIEQLVNYLYGTMNFDKVTYKIENIDGKQALVIDIKEKSVNDIKLGIHYDTDFRNGLLLNYTSNKVFINELKFQTSVLIGESPRANMKLLFNSNGVVNPILEINAEDLNMKYYDDYKSAFWYRNKSLSGKFSLFTNLHSNFRIGGSMEWLRYKFKFEDFDDINFPSQKYINLSFQIDLDSWNKTYYPTKGTYLRILTRLIDETKDEKLTYASLEASLRLEPMIPVYQKLVIQPKLFAGAIINNHDEDPVWYLYKLGGAFNWKSPQYIPFVGYKFGQAINKAYLIARTDIQFEFLKNHYLIAKMNIIKENETLESIVKQPNNIFDFQWGYGLSYAYNSLIGPLELNISRSHLGQTNVYFSFGFLF